MLPLDVLLSKTLVPGGQKGRKRKRKKKGKCEMLPGKRGLAMLFVRVFSIYLFFADFTLYMMPGIVYEQGETSSRQQEENLLEDSTGDGDLFSIIEPRCTPQPHRPHFNVRIE